ncbi:uncharacterized protein METZ01_LOCUS217334 [marine metagenome]|uniref:Uncharacterized protein n=1 Tax=marine metagenome TaxID=408172 RepID=A0A382FN75_9ZZZZ
MSFDNSRLNERLLSPYGSDSAEDDLNVIIVSGAGKFRSENPYNNMITQIKGQ